MEYVEQRAAERIRARLVPDGDCLLWPGKRVKGYGQLAIRDGQRVIYRYIHRLLYEVDVAPIPDGLTIDHLCQQPLCGNTDHMEVVTFAENRKRVDDRRDSCRRGHPFTPENTRVNTKGWRECRVCDRDRAYARSGKGQDRRGAYNVRNRGLDLTQPPLVGHDT